jgi:surface carbohydrate biosynthesis protein
MTLLKVLLESRYGHQVMLAPNDNHEFLDDVFDPDLVALPYLWRPANVARARELRERGVAVVVIMPEGHSILDYLMDQVAGVFTDISVADRYFVWNETAVELIRKYKTLPDDRVVLGGVPRFDFYRAPLRRLHATREAFCKQYGLDPRRRIVTWATNFGFVNLADNPEAIAWTQRKYEEEGTSRFPLFADIGKVVSAEVAGRQILGDAVVQLALKLPDVNFVIKPHPAEQPGWYFALRDAAGVDNITVIQRAVIWDILNPTDIHLHRSCTTAAEAWLLGKPTIDLQLDPNETWFSPDMATAGDVARDYDDLLDAVSRYLEDPTIPAKYLEPRSRVIRRWFGDVDGHRTELHAAEIDRLLGSRSFPRRRRARSRRLSAMVRLRWALGLEHYDSLSRVFQSRTKRGQFDERSGRDRYIRSSDVAEWTRRIRTTLSEQ